MVSWLQRFGLPRNAAVIIVFTCFIALVAVLLMGCSSYHPADRPAHPGTARHAGEGQKELLKLRKSTRISSHDRISQIFTYIGSDMPDLGQRVLSFSLSSVRSIITLLV